MAILMVGPMPRTTSRMLQLLTCDTRLFREAQGVVGLKLASLAMRVYQVISSMADVQYHIVVQGCNAVTFTQATSQGWEGSN